MNFDHFKLSRNSKHALRNHPKWMLSMIAANYNTAGTFDFMFLFLRSYCTSCTVFIYIGVMVSALILVHGATVYREYCKNCLTQGKELSDWSQLVSAVAVVLITRVTL